MIPSPASLASDLLVGNSAAWHLAFEKDGEPILEIGSDDYHAEIRASLPGDLGAGSYSFTVEGLTDGDYKKLPAELADQPLVVRLFLYWREMNQGVGGYLSNLAGLTGGGVKAALKDYLVAVLAVTGVSRRAGGHRYDTVITAREWIYDMVATKPVCEGATTTDATAALKLLLKDAAGLKDEHFVLTEPSRLTDADCVPEDPPVMGTELRDFAKGPKVLAPLRTFGERLEASSGRRGRGMFLIRDGKLYVGERKIPLKGNDDKPLTLAGGLVATEPLETVVTDPNFNYCEERKKAGPLAEVKPPQRRQFRLTLKGRPDLKPGDVVKFGCPPEEKRTTLRGAFSALADFVGPLVPSLDELDPPVRLYVNSVEHKLGRTSGFVTTLTGVELKATEPHGGWDCHTQPREESEGETESTPASAEAAAAHAVRRVARRTADARQLPEVGEVRSATVKSEGEAAAQTLLLWRGLGRSDGKTNRARRLPVARPPVAPATGAAYLTPFAWSKCGLVLPRYPGTRVLVEHRLGQADEPIDVGALWLSSDVPDSQAGDWWLSLPAEVPAADRAAFTDDTKVPAPYTGKASHDLTDADGNRVIEVGELTIRVTRGKLTAAGTRPIRATPADSVTIEHADGEAMISIDKNGKITLKGKSIELDAGSGSITLKGSSVDVQ